MSERTITVVTGTRAEYGLLKSSMREIRDRQGLSLTTVATGMHLSPQHGSTVDTIRDDGFTVDREVEMLLYGDTGRSMAKSLGIGTSGLADALSGLDPDSVLVLGDRDEALAAALAAAHMNVPVAHIHGGDAMQGAIIDDSIRHAITKFAHLHFPASELSKERILKLGEEAWRVTVAGAPGLDDVDSEAQATESTVANALDLDRERPLALLVQHPLTTEPDRAGAQMRATLDAVAGFDLETVVIYPNSDAGGTAMINAIDDHAPDGFHTYDSLPREQYLGLLDTADVMIGNSSSAIIEAPSFGLPAVDIGPRQDGRERADNIVDVSHDTDTIRSGIERALADESLRERAQQCDNPYDQGGAAERIVDRLKSVELDEQLLRKQLTY